MRSTRGVPIEVVFVCPALVRGDETARGRRRVSATAVRSPLEVSERVLRRMVDRDGPDGLAAIAHVPDRRSTTIDVDARHA